ncbi:MAG: Uncharacterized protein XD54_0402 [Thermococcus sibiricus]|uniref:Uncharacterized protein n=1 Tax=Thermococcus sibiricus TaxID=172049 RepID=A0A117L1N3_9EURY|nr:MAG: Uncharacterized protein XD54_0402 [Thermococcus sibiricus]
MQVTSGVSTKWLLVLFLLFFILFGLKTLVEEYLERKKGSENAYPHKRNYR